MTFFKRHWLKILILILIIVAGIIFFSQKKNEIKLGSLETGNITEIVSVSGSVESAQKSNLSFQKSGKVKEINVKIGDRVKKGDVLATLSADNDLANILNAKANVYSAEANLADIKNGASKEDIASSEQNLANAKANLILAYNSIPDSLRTVYTNITDTLGDKIGSLFTFDGSRYQLITNICNQNLETEIESDRLTIVSKVNTLKQSINNFKYVNLTINDEDLKNTDLQTDILSEQIANLTNTTSNLLDNLNTSFTSSCLISNTGLNDARNEISIARTNLNNTINTVNTLKSQILTYRSTYYSTKNALAQTLAGATAEKIKSLSAQVDVAKANLVLAEANYNQNFIYAPFSGLITNVNINLGEIANQNQNAIEIIADNNLELKVKLSEVDVFKIKKDQKVNITFDSYGNGVVFEGIISSIDPTPANEGNSNSYYARINFTKEDGRILSGLNSSADIVVSEKENVNYLSPAFIKIVGDKAFVNVVKNVNEVSVKDLEEKEVVIGIKGEDGKVEIISGITKEDKLYPYDSTLVDTSKK